jgi:acyl-CoA thioesterase I
MKKILIIADSMAMPREEYDYEKTWLYKFILSFNDYCVIDKSHRGSTSNRLISEGGGFKNVQPGSDLLEFYNPDYVIIQLGIVDCSPRYISINSLTFKIINNLPMFIQNLFYKFKKKFSIRKLKYAYVSLGDYRSNFTNYLNRAKETNTKVILCAIAPVEKSFVEKSPEIQKAIELYNGILKELSNSFDNVDYFDPYSIEFGETSLIDELHFNHFGHDFFHKQLIKFDLN